MRLPALVYPDGPEGHLNAADSPLELSCERLIILLTISNVLSWSSSVMRYQFWERQGSGSATAVPMLEEQRETRSGHESSTLASRITRVRASARWPSTNGLYMLFPHACWEIKLWKICRISSRKKELPFSLPTKLFSYNSHGSWITHFSPER